METNKQRARKKANKLESRKKVENNPYVPHLPKGNSSSSLRQKAASAATSADNAGSTKNSKRNKRRRHRRKNKNLDSKLLLANVPENENKLDTNFINTYHVFVDGGDDGNPPIKPDCSHTTKQVKVLRIADGTLNVLTKHHKMKKGLEIRRDDGNPIFILCERKETLDVTQLTELSANNLIDAFEKAISTSNTMKRGNDILVMGEKYVCVGSATKRAGTGCWTIHHAMKPLENDIQDRILNHLKKVEKLFAQNLPTNVIRQVMSGIELSDAPLFSTTAGGTSLIYQAFAIGKNIYLSGHVDKDFTYSAVTVLKRGEYTIDDKIIAYFNFPRLGLAIPLKPGDVLFFDPKEPHMISSRCRNDDDIYCLSFYLKSNLIGGNDNSMPLTDKQGACLSHYKTTNNN